MENRDLLERMRKLSNLQPLSESEVYKAEDGDVLAEGYDGDALVEMTLGELATWLGKECPEGREDEAVTATLDEVKKLKAKKENDDEDEDDDKPAFLKGKGDDDDEDEDDDDEDEEGEDESAKSKGKKVEEEITPQKQKADSQSGADTTVVKADTAVVEPRNSETDQKAKSTEDGPVALKIDSGEEMVEMTLSTLANMMGKEVTGEKGEELVEMKISEFVIAVGDVKASEVLQALKK